MYYQTFMPQYLVLTNPLNGIKKAEKFLWKEEIEQDIIELKKAFTEGGIQAFPDFGVGDPFILTTCFVIQRLLGSKNRKPNSNLIKANPGVSIVYL